MKKNKNIKKPLLTLSGEVLRKLTSHELTQVAAGDGPADTHAAETVCTSSKPL